MGGKKLHRKHKHGEAWKTKKKIGSITKTIYKDFRGGKTWPGNTDGKNRTLRK